LATRITLPDDGGWTVAGAIMGKVQNVLLWGPPGTGKSTFACRHGVTSWYRTVCHEEMSDVDILGGPTLHGDGSGATVADYALGVGLRAWESGSRLVVDEIDKAGGAALSALLAILDDRAIAAYTIPMTGETRRPAEGFHCVGTMNASPDDLPDALKDRFTVRLLIDQPHPDAIASLPEDLRAAATVSAKAAERRRVSQRGWMEFARLRFSTNDEPLAAAAVFGVDRGQEILDALTISRSGGDPAPLVELFT
jgi:MoxR-like ATPase